MATKHSEAGAAPGAGWNPAWETRENAIPKARYIDPDFAKLEAEKLWPHVWQMACREEQVARPGDYTVYQIVDQEILIIRVDENTIKAYHNVCPHRATTLAVGSGRFSTGEITCPFHGWRWNLEGDCTFVLDRNEFKGGCLSDEDVALRECRVATWIGCVFINMDKDAPSFDDHIAPIRPYIDPLGLENMKFYWHKSVKVPSNWKIAQEAFHEAYHVPETHPQLDPRRGGLGSNIHSDFSYESHENGHSRFWNTGGRSTGGRALGGSNLTKEEQIKKIVDSMILSEEGMDAMVLLEEVNLAKSLWNREIPEGKTVAEEWQRLLYEHYANRGRFIPKAEDIAKVGDALIFPNYTFLPAYGNLLAYRARPLPDNDPDWCEFEIFSFRSYGDGETPPRYKVQRMTDLGDPEQYRLIPRQDASNIPKVQRGLHSHGFEECILSERQEIFISNMHRELDRYLTA